MSSRVSCRPACIRFTKFTQFFITKNKAIVSWPKKTTQKKINRMKCVWISLTLTLSILNNDDDDGCGIKFDKFFIFERTWYHCSLLNIFCLCVVIIIELIFEICIENGSSSLISYMYYIQGVSNGVIFLLRVVCEHNHEQKLFYAYGPTGVRYVV